MEENKPCKHLDYETEFIGCELQVMSDGVKFWQRQDIPYEGAPINVQFCKLRGRVNNIWSCYQNSNMGCYQPEVNDETTD